MVMQNSNRSWPVPNKPWVMEQTWHDLLFAHWEIDADLLRPHIPEPLEIDTFDGRAWIGVVPFTMSDIRVRYLPEIPYINQFPELNVRTYVTYQGKPGVFFFSLDATNFVAVQTARTFFHLPYYFAKINVKKENETIYYQCQRKSTETFQFNGSYKPISNVFYTQSGSLEYWLTERYCLYTKHGETLYRGDIDHDPWPLQKAEAIITENSMISIEGYAIPENDPLLHYSKKLHVRLWGLVEV
jgi:uncharacterized protein